MYKLKFDYEIYLSSAHFSDPLLDKNVDPIQDIHP